MSYDTFQTYGLDAVTLLADQDWTESLDDEGYHEALASMLAYLNHAATE